MSARPLLIALPLILAACGGGAVSPSPQPPGASATPEERVQINPEPTDPVDPSMINRRVEGDEVYRFSGLIPRDGIRPIYEPIFETAQAAPLIDEELIIGVAIENEAKAYPISVLRFREMVNDEVAGWPVLVTW